MDVRDYIAASAADFSRALREWLAIPSVSADPARHGDVRASAEWLAGYLRETGFPVVEVWETGGLPAVYAHWPAADPAAQRVLVYGHHDVQPAALEDGWDYEPFAPQEKDGRIFGRGASDDKGQVLFHALGVRALLAARDDDAPPVSITMLIEGEEESGSPNFAALLEKRKDELKPDVIVVSDTTMWAADIPSICTGMRGLADAEVTLTGPSRDLHSGSFGGGVPNPAHALAALLAGLHDADGRVTLPGFYDDVVPLTEEERALLAKLPFDQQSWLADAGDSGATYGEAGHTTLERIWARPTAEVNGLWGGHTGPGGKTIIPKAAHAKLSFRLVADQEPAKVVESLRRYVAANCRTASRRPSPNAAGYVPAARRSTRPVWRRPAGPCSGRSAPRCSSPRRAAAARRRTWPTSSARRSSSWPWGLTRTGSTHPMSMWIFPGCCSARSRSPTCGKRSPALAWLDERPGRGRRV